MRTIEIKKIGHRLESLQLEESVIYEISMVEHLNGDTVDTHTFSIFDSDNTEVTSDFAKSSSISNNVLSLGVYAFAVGVYEIRSWITCNETLPDSTTSRTFLIELILTVK